MRNWLYDFLANKIDWLKQDFRKYRRKGAFRMWFDGTNYPGKNGAYTHNFSTAD
jgi:predicted metal-dependent hydrolase